MVIWYLGAVVLCTYAVLAWCISRDSTLKALAWGGLSARPWIVSMLFTVVAFFVLVLNDVGTEPHWVWFLVSAALWVPALLVDHACFQDHMVSALTVWSTALATVFLFQDALDEEPRDIAHVVFAAILMFHHVVMDGVAWLHTDGN